jgi:alpha-N-arabinofuranosidase
MEAGIVAFQNEESFYKIVVEQVNNKYHLIVASANEEFARTELSAFKPGQKIYLKMQMLDNEFICSYSLDEISWSELGGVLDGKHLSTKVAGGYIGAYFGLYTYAKSPAKAKFDWAKYKEIK